MKDHARRKPMDGSPSIHPSIHGSWEDGDTDGSGTWNAERMESRGTSSMAPVDDDRSFAAEGSLTKWMMLRHRHPPTVRFLRLFLTSSCIPRRGAPLPFPLPSLFRSSAVQVGPRTDGPEGPTPPLQRSTHRPFVCAGTRKGKQTPLFFVGSFPLDRPTVRFDPFSDGFLETNSCLFDPPFVPLSVSRDPTLSPTLPSEYSLPPMVGRSHRTVDILPGRQPSVTLATAVTCGPHTFQKDAADERQSMHVRTIKCIPTRARPQVPWTRKMPRKSREGCVG